LIDVVEHGEEFIIARHNRPVAKLVMLSSTMVRKPGSMKGKIRMADDFNAPLPDHILDDFEGSMS